MADEPVEGHPALQRRHEVRRRPLLVQDREGSDRDIENLARLLDEQARGGLLVTRAR